jgi:hypothetical protein
VSKRAAVVEITAMGATLAAQAVGQEDAVMRDGGVTGIFNGAGRDDLRTWRADIGDK